MQDANIHIMHIAYTYTYISMRIYVFINILESLQVMLRKLGSDFRLSLDHIKQCLEASWIAHAKVRANFVLLEMN